jgi:hypothetical protein
MKEQAAELKAEKSVIQDQSMEMLQARTRYNDRSAHQSSSHTEGEESDVVGADTETDEETVPAKRQRQQSTRPQGKGPSSSGKGRRSRVNDTSPHIPRILPLRSATQEKKSCSVARKTSTAKEPSQKDQYSDIFGTALPVTITKNPHFSTSFSPPNVGMPRIPKLPVAKKSAPIIENMDASGAP